MVKWVLWKEETLDISNQFRRMMETTKRPWGKYTILFESELTKIKKICVDDGQILSYQSHENRCEDWIILEGVGFVVLDGVKKEIKMGDHIRIEKNVKHRVGCESGMGVLKFIEVQTGTYFGEDDITRYEDEYGRV